MRRSLHVRADRKLLSAVGASRRWLSVDVVAPRSAPRATDAREGLDTVARGARLLVGLPPGATVVSPNPFPMRREGDRTVLELGTLVADQVLSLILCVQFPAGTPGEPSSVQCRLVDDDGVLDAGPVAASFTYATHAASAAQPRDREVAREAAAAYAERVRQKAVEEGRRGDYAGGRAILATMAARLREYAGRDREILEIVDALEKEAGKLEHLHRLDSAGLDSPARRGLASGEPDAITLGTMGFLTERTLQMVAQAESHGTLDAPFFVTAVTSDAEATQLAEAAGRALAAGSPSGFGYTVVGAAARVLDPGRGVRVTRDDERGLASALGAQGKGVKVAFVRGILADGAPRRWYPAEGVAIVSLDGWDEAGPAARAFVAYEMALESCRHGRGDFDPAAARHAQARGCWGDAGDRRAEIETRLREGHLCDECRRRYADAGIDVEAFLVFVAIVRRIAARRAGPR